MPKYIHYGSDKFDPKRFTEIKNPKPLWVKPYSGGLWASPIDSKFSWKDWCESEQFELDRLKTSFIFDLSPKAKVLEIKGISDIEKAEKQKLIIRYNTAIPLIRYVIDFEKIKKKGYDVILFVENDETHFPLYGWDCDSILVLNKKVIIV